jgi:hypothetical protein
MKKHFYCISDIKKNSTMTWRSALALSARGSDARARAHARQNQDARALSITDYNKSFVVNIH